MHQHKPALSAWCTRGSVSCTSQPCQQQRKLAPLITRVQGLGQRQQQAVPARASCHSARAHLQGEPGRQHTPRRPTHTHTHITPHIHSLLSTESTCETEPHTQHASFCSCCTRRRHQSSPPQRCVRAAVGVPHPSPPAARPAAVQPSAAMLHAAPCRRT